MNGRRFIFVTPVLPWPADQGSKWFLLDSARSLRSLGEVDWVTREIGDQTEARKHLEDLGFRLHLDRSFVAGDPLRRALRRLSIEQRARAWGLPREAAYTCTPTVCRLVAELGNRHPRALVFGAFWYAFKALEAVERGRRWLILSDVESARERDAVQLGSGSARLQRALEEAERRALRSAQGVLCLSREDADSARRLEPALEPLLWPLRFPEWSDNVESPRHDQGESLNLLVYGHWGADFNRDGLAWFLREIWPGIRSQIEPQPRLRLIGRGLPGSIATRATELGIEVVGFVEDLRAEFARCDAVLVPLRFAGGLRYRLLEALAARVPCLATSVAAGGSDAVPGEHFLECSDVRTWVDALRVVADRSAAAALALRGRAFVELRWGAAGHDQRLAEVLDRIRLEEAEQS